MLDLLRAADTDLAFAGEVLSFVEEIKQTFDHVEIRTYLDRVMCIGSFEHVTSDDVYEGMLGADAIDEDPVGWAEEVLLSCFARAKNHCSDEPSFNCRRRGHAATSRTEA